MTRDEWQVKEFGIRPAGSPDHCFYCGEPRGGTHKADCVIRERTVVVKLTIEYTITVPEHWTPEDIEFHRNESSWCTSNALPELEKLDENGCLCHGSSFEYVREATLEDEKQDGVFVWNSPS